MVAVYRLENAIVKVLHGSAQLKAYCARSHAEEEFMVTYSVMTLNMECESRDQI